jgi:hypothetical protein
VQLTGAEWAIARYRHGIDVHEEIYMCRAKAEISKRVILIVSEESVTTEARILRFAQGDRR